MYNTAVTQKVQSITVITNSNFGCFKRYCKSFKCHLNRDKQFNFLPAIDNYNLWTNVDVIRGGLLGGGRAGVGLIEGEGRKMPWKICNDAARVAAPRLGSHFAPACTLQTVSD